LIIEEGASPGLVLNVFLSILFASMSLGTLGPLFSAIASARGAASSLYRIIDHKSLIDPSSVIGMKPDSIVGQIEFKNVHFRTYLPFSLKH
jgi:ABC-type multidrug transport system fused ATPase/permease subunit